MASDTWDPLPYDEWRDTYATLHMWSQIVGKIALALVPPMNHSWAVAFHPGARGLRTAMLPHGDRSFTIEFDFIDHQLVIETSEGQRRALPLRPQSVADFYREVMTTLEAMGLPVRIWPMPVEIPSPIPFDRDTVHHSYDAAFANRFWKILVQVHRVFSNSRCHFLGKCSPVHFFWGAFDLAVTRFSGRLAPRRDGPAFMNEAYSHEVISHGFWPGNDLFPEPAFYAYAVPEPEGFKSVRVRPEAAYYHAELGEFILPYEAMRTTAAPAEAIAAFVDSTYEHAATLAGWDRAALEKPA